MISHRTLFRLLPAFLAVLLLAAAPAGAQLRSQGGVSAEVLKDTAKTLALYDRAKGERHHTDAVTAYLEVDDEKEAHAAPAMRAKLSAVQQSPVSSSRPRYRAASRTYPSCAAPPTGPPHV